MINIHHHPLVLLVLLSLKLQNDLYMNEKKIENKQREENNTEKKYISLCPRK